MSVRTKNTIIAWSYFAAALTLNSSKKKLQHLTDDMQIGLYKTFFHCYLQTNFFRTYLIMIIIQMYCPKYLTLILIDCETKNTELIFIIKLFLQK